jgi:hypothetical protein
VSPLTNQLPPSPWTIYVHNKTGMAFEIPTDWWTKSNAQYDLMAGPAGELVASLEVRSTSILHCTLQETVEEDSASMHAPWKCIENRSVIVASIPIIQCEWRLEHKPEPLFVRRAYIACGDRALTIGAVTRADVRNERIAMLDHALRTMSALPASQRNAVDVFAPIYGHTGLALHDTRSEMIEFVR